MQTITILGSTGSIGKQTIEVAKKHNIKVKGLAAASDARSLALQARELGAEYVCIADSSKYRWLKDELSDAGINVLCGSEGNKTIAQLDGVDKLVNSVVGIAGLEPVLAAIEAGTDVALANKETLVAGGELVMKNAREKGARILPVDSEHSAVFQCLEAVSGDKSAQVRGMILTASGGPFYSCTREELSSVTAEQALKHPTWRMGKKVTVDSSTLMNKGLEFIEAMRLFDLAADQIEVVIHRQSVLHSAIELSDYSVLAQLGVPDMKIPIQYAVLYPERHECPTKRLSLAEIGSLTFEKPDFRVFDCLKTCIEAAHIGGAAPACVSAADEEAVSAFLAGKIGFLQIGELVSQALSDADGFSADSLEEILCADRTVKERTRKRIEKII